jgi:hypothetical protein
VKFTYGVQRRSNPGAARTKRWIASLALAMTEVVMAGHSRLKNGVASACLCPGHPRLCSVDVREDVDARHEAGHDDTC